MGLSRASKNSTNAIYALQIVPFLGGPQIYVLFPLLLFAFLEVQEITDSGYRAEFQ
jgi:hypothetical protein